MKPLNEGDMVMCIRDYENDGIYKNHIYIVSKIYAYNGIFAIHLEGINVAEGVSGFVMNWDIRRINECTNVFFVSLKDVLNESEIAKLRRYIAT